METNRPLTSDERSVLETFRVAKPQGSAPFGAFLTFIVTLGVILIVTPESWQVGVRSLVPVLAALVASALVFQRLDRSTDRSDRRKRIDHDLTNGVALVTTVRVIDAIRVEEFEDEGSSYYLRLDDHRVLFLSGQYLYEVEEDGRFPSTVVCVVRAPATRVVFDIACEGTPLQPSTELPPFSTEDYQLGRVPEDGAVLLVDFESLRGRRA